MLWIRFILFLFCFCFCFCNIIPTLHDSITEFYIYISYLFIVPPLYFFKHSVNLAQYVNIVIVCQFIYIFIYIVMNTCTKIKRLCESLNLSTHSFSQDGLSPFLNSSTQEYHLVDKNFKASVLTRVCQYGKHSDESWLFSLFRSKSFNRVSCKSGTNANDSFRKVSSDVMKKSIKWMAKKEIK